MNVFEHPFFKDVKRDLSYEVVEQSMLDLASQYGVVSASSAQIRGAPMDKPLIAAVNRNTETEYISVYKREGLAHNDVALQRALKQEDPFYWSDVKPDIKRKEERAVFDAAADFGYEDGIVVPFFGYAGRSGLTSFMGKKLRNDPEAKGVLELVGQKFYRFTVQRSNAVNENMELLWLTDRQKQIVYWVAEGKTDDEIATILGISKNTVGRHQEKIREKLDVRNKIEMLRKVIQLDLLNQSEFLD